MRGSCFSFFSCSKVSVSVTVADMVDVVEKLRTLTSPFSFRGIGSMVLTRDIEWKEKERKDKERELGMEAEHLKGGKWST